ncbi:MAG: methylmalonyl-CoA mutase family protein, partial [Pseudomonadota bacterium]
MANEGAIGNWEALATKALKGAPLSDLDASAAPYTGNDGTIAPFALPASPVYSGRANAGPWSVVARVETDGDAAAGATGEDLMNGADALSLVFAGAPTAFGRGMGANNLAALEAALEGVELSAVSIGLEAGRRGGEALALFLALCRDKKATPAAFHAGLDAILAGDRLCEGLALCNAAHLRGTVALADGRIAAEAGAAPAREVAFAALSLAAALKSFDDGGIGPAKALPRIAVALSASQDQFATIAKLRAMRRLHAMIAKACKVKAPLHLSATTEQRMLSVTDPHTNLLRLTVASMGAAIGGADAITVLPFEPSGRPFARRMSRNIQRLMLEEAHVARLFDPAAGSGSLEALTDTIAEAAWDLFKAHGAGNRDALLDGRFAALVAEDEAAER